MKSATEHEFPTALARPVFPKQMSPDQSSKVPGVDKLCGLTAPHPVPAQLQMTGVATMTPSQRIRCLRAVLFPLNGPCRWVAEVFFSPRHPSCWAGRTVSVFPWNPVQHQCRRLWQMFSLSEASNRELDGELQLLDIWNTEFNIQPEFTEKAWKTLKHRNPS